MGGRGSGGHNRKHGRIEDVKYSRVDSFSLKSLLQGDKYLNYKECVEISGEYSTVRYYPCDGKTVIIGNGIYCETELDRVFNIDGCSTHFYFRCPCCGRRARYLYRDHDRKTYLCRSCAGLNYESQQAGRTDKMIRRMENIVESKLCWNDWYKAYDYIAMVSAPTKPKYMRWEKYNSLLSELKQLQHMYYLKEVKSLGSLRHGIR